jgi:hypothetical protein
MLVCRDWLLHRPCGFVLWKLLRILELLTDQASPSLSPSMLLLRTEFVLLRIKHRILMLHQRMRLIGGQF